ncbi:DUF6350 family protein [Microlunatus sp. Gsoil 973]|uniref:cell division protein PerM n=1 Tax=Microlunatus sp. Gsoil 973 TaxID=2672569 RepID=UPI0012B4E186|nr:DUF6350 family protein [Microlunatus sp. Gsoil 973]QGN35161.1 hypothetical protein GJV80_22630 [Microlunatus sp. Gsoil 973]
MASLLSSRRSGRSSRRQAPDVPLTTARAEEAGSDPAPYGPRYGWQLLVVGGVLATAVAGWILVAGLTVVGWLAADPGDLGAAMHTGTRLWLLANGTPADLAGVHWSLTPLGMSLVIAFMISRFTRAAVRYADPDDSEALRVILGAAGLATVGYAVIIAAVGLSSGAEITRGVVGAALLAALGGLWGAVRGADLRLTARWPVWARSLPVAIAGALGVLLLAGVAVLTTGIVANADRIASLTAGLGAGAVGGIALWAAQAAFAPNVIVWCASYALGAGFRIGQGSVVAPSDSSLGLLPSIPILGALPGSGPGNELNLLWLLSGVAAGAVAAVLVVRGRPAARPDETSLVGGLAAVVAALVFAGLAWTTGGDLGDGRLTGAGPRSVELLVMSCTLLGLSGMICGLLLGVIGLLRRRSQSRADRSMEEDDTVAVDVPPGAENDTTRIPVGAKGGSD